MTKLGEVGIAGGDVTLTVAFRYTPAGHLQEGADPVLPPERDAISRRSDEFLSL
ncbi:hypothetical protein [Rhizobium sp. SL42]|uniref:hypothetical protein n=1 Tax=Rhizobium sp. SL42 TaxID=2806346 RepID=UPI001F3926D3|nr:hypothetical protein [Rhizobium sp. SL42]UJW73402.1 hypothetical protein IM739_10735 [Rhizobium sp. SL42]